MRDGGYALKTYRYLRLLLVALVLLLAVSVVLEIVAAGGGCWRTSISSYYWTPVRGVFVGTLVAVGVCLIVLKGNTDLEDVLLNVAGALAPVVAFVPITDPHECQSTPWPPAADGRAEVVNNVGALLVVAVIGLGAAWVLARGEGRGRPTRAQRAGLAMGAALVAAGVLLFVAAPAFFARWGHYLAAVPLFLLLLAVMIVNALSLARVSADRDGRDRPQRTDLANRYLALTVVTVVVVAALALVTWLGSWQHGTFWVEVAVIAAFAVFWVVQTIELWQAPDGLRADPEATAR